MLLNYNPITKENGDALIVGRGSVAIYLALTSLRCTQKKVIVPGNICYAAVLPIIYAGFIPVFCDVDKLSGNILLDNIIREYNSDIVAVIVPHMYGNPVKDLLDIRKFCDINNVILIEDCASFMGGDFSDYTPGTIGDYIIYSTGYSKTLDLGIGGILFSSKHDLKSLEQVSKMLPLYDKSFEYESNMFSRIYRVIRNYDYNTALSKDFFKIVPQSMKKSFLFSIDGNTEDSIIKNLGELNRIKKERRYNYQIYSDILSKLDFLEEYDFLEGAIPWRYNMYISPSMKKDFINYCLSRQIPVSDWYPSVLPVFGIDKKLSETEWHEQRILNLPILLQQDEICRICDTIKSYKN